MYFTLMKNTLFDDWDRTIDVNCRGTANGMHMCMHRRPSHRPPRHY
jgi:NADP-dependent 3-hydroxy acid dehydrogenase YdfG